ncbi:hypothetical protein LBMAG56_42140 [Verrucomicrobiota bacterium]|nr:hypothetical protein LBMAG56_42140 [Verrucomicrobiota bacterium]
MALVLEGNYSKKIGLAGYSSHQFSLTLKTEITDIAQVPAEAARLYRLLQDGVDTSIKEVGFLPGPANGNGTSSSNGHTQPQGNRNGTGNGHGNGHPANGPSEIWNCTPKQRDLILKIVAEQQLDKNVIEGLAQERFGKGVKQLNKLEASGLIEELFEKYPGRRSGNANGNNHHRQTTPTR